MSRFLSSRYQKLEPYTPGEQPKSTGRLIKLNTNENPYPPAPGVMGVLDQQAAQQLKLYSDPDAFELVSAIAEYYGLEENQVMVGNGSDEILAFAFMAFQRDSRKMYFPEISYSFYPVYCSIFQAEGIQIPLQQDFSIDPADYADLEGTIVITNPNAPTGMALSVEEIRSILETNKDQLVIIDEAYVDFGGESAVSLLKDYDNLLVIQTFSKSRSLAGARIGFALGSREIIEDLNRIKFSFNPYNLNRLSILAGIEAMRDTAYFQETCQRIIKTRQEFVRKLEALDFQVLRSKANFVFARSNRISGEDYFHQLRQRNIIVRYFQKPKIQEFVRITIGTEEEMEQLLQATEDILHDRREGDRP